MAPGATLQAKEVIGEVRWLKIRQIAQECYGGDEAKARVIAERRESKGQYRIDPEFPEDRDERRRPPPIIEGASQLHAAWTVHGAWHPAGRGSETQGPCRTWPRVQLARRMAEGRLA